MNKVTNFIGGLKGSVDVDIILDKKPQQKYFKIKPPKGDKIKLPIYTGNQDLSGIVRVELKQTKKYQHLGIKVMLIGHLQIYNNKDLSTEFYSLSKELEPAGFLRESREFKFKFTAFEKEYETFRGSAGRVRYFIRVTINRNMKNPITKELDFAVLQYHPNIEEKTEVTPIKMEVGASGSFHLSFESNKNYYHLKDVIIGRAHFTLSAIDIKYMQIQLIRKQVFGTGKKIKSEPETMIRYEVMDGCPAKDQIIPIRMYLNGVQLTPSHENIHNRLSVRYGINLLLVDEEGTKYEREADITIYRKE